MNDEGKKKRTVETPNAEGNSGTGRCMDACRQQGSSSRMRERENPDFLCCPASCAQVVCVGDGSEKASEDGVFGMWKVDFTLGG